jgi:hypothetical protein
VDKIPRMKFLSAFNRKSKIENLKWLGLSVIAFVLVVQGLPFGLTHIVVVVRIAARKFVLTAYGIERKGGR